MLTYRFETIESLSLISGNSSNALTLRELYFHCQLKIRVFFLFGLPLLKSPFSNQSISVFFSNKSIQYFFDFENKPCLKASYFIFHATLGLLYTSL